MSTSTRRIRGCRRESSPNTLGIRRQLVHCASAATPGNFRRSNRSFMVVPVRNSDAKPMPRGRWTDSIARSFPSDGEFRGEPCWSLFAVPIGGHAHGTKGTLL